jgi:hypothetical protein
LLSAAAARRGVGQRGVAGYSHYLGMSAADFIKSTDSLLTAADTAAAVVQPAGTPIFQGDDVRGFRQWPASSA